MIIIILIYLFSAICVAVLLNATELDSMYVCDKMVFILTPLLNSVIALVSAYFGARYLIKKIRS